MNVLKIILLLAGIALATTVTAGLHSNKSKRLAEFEQVQETDQLMRLGKFKTDKIPECSGTTRSLNQPNAFWAINDSGQANEVYLVDYSGQLLATCKLEGFPNKDWESLTGFTLAGEHFLMVADVGDNLERRDDYRLALFKEPKLQLKRKQKQTGLPQASDQASNQASNQNLVQTIAKTIRPTVIRMKYSDGKHNCEAIAVDVVGRKLFLVEKVYASAASSKTPSLYQADLDLAALIPKAQPKSDSTTIKIPADILAKPIGQFPIRNVTGMAIDDSGTKMIVRNYLNAHYFERSPKETWSQTLKRFQPKPIAMPLQQQSESIFFDADPNFVIVTSEGIKTGIWKVKLPTEKKNNGPSKHNAPTKDKTSDRKHPTSRDTQS